MNPKGVWGVGGGGQKAGKEGAGVPCARASKVMAPLVTMVGVLG